MRGKNTVAITIAIIMALSLSGFLVFYLRQPEQKSIQGPPEKKHEDNRKQDDAQAIRPRKSNPIERNSAEQHVANTLKQLFNRHGEAVEFAETGNYNGLSRDELENILLDEERSTKDRRQAAWALARMDSPDGIASLQEILLNQKSPPYLKAIIAEALGYSQLEKARELLNIALNDTDEVVVRGAIRGYTARGDQEAVTILGGTLNNPVLSVSLRAEAALGLGEIGQPGAFALLSQAFEREIDFDDETMAAVIDGIGQRDFMEVQDFYEKILFSDQAVSPEKQILAINSLAHSTSAAAPLLLTCLEKDDARIRAAASWTLTSIDLPEGTDQQIINWIDREKDPETRANLYLSLQNGSGADAGKILDRALKEPDADVRMAGFDTIASLLSSPDAPVDQDMMNRYNHEAIPEVKRQALSSGQNLEEKLSAVIILQKADTPAARQALAEIANVSKEPKVAEAAKSWLATESDEL